MTGKQHLSSVGLLIVQLQVIEYSARVTIRILSEEESPPVDFAHLREGDWVPEDAVTNYDALGMVLKRFNELAPAQYRVDARRLVDLRNQLAHGRLVSLASARGTLNHFPLVTVKFGKPKSGEVQITARIEMTEKWFTDQRVFLDRAVHAVMSAQGPALFGNVFPQPHQGDGHEGRKS